MKHFKNKNIGILGLGKTGTSCFKALNQQANIICWDDSKQKQNEFAIIFGQENLIELNNPQWKKLDFIILSPGINPNHPVVQTAIKRNIRILSDIEILYLNNPQARYICTTATNGKSTVVALIGHIISKHANCAIGGNIGIACLDLPLSSTYVLEFSSYQIDLLQEFYINIGVLLNITPDHLDRYGTFKNYINSKRRMLQFMDSNSVLIVSVDNQHTKQIQEATTIPTIPISCFKSVEHGIYITQNKIIDNISHIEIEFSTQLKGAHNLENIAASYAACKAFGLSPQAMVDAISSFQGLEHRMQFIGKYKNIEFYNDSKATNAQSTMHAILNLKNIYWLAGGEPKAEGISPLTDSIYNVKQAYFFGKAKWLFAETMQAILPTTTYETMDQALNQAITDALNDNDEVTILMSPACASFDQFSNFEERGKHFIKLVSRFIGG